MKYLQVAGFLEHSTVNGEGFRSVLFLSGCPHHCSECQNEAMQDFSYGEQVSFQAILQRIQKVLPLIDGITLSGGEPFMQACVLTDFLKCFKHRFPTLSVWCYTGYTYENLLQEAAFCDLLQYIDILIDGPFIKTLKNPNLKYRGSSNQRILRLTHEGTPILLNFD